MSGQFVSLMNNTKWHILITDLINGKVDSPIVSMKYVRSEIVHGPSHVNWNEVVEWKYIEWIKIHPVEIVKKSKLGNVTKLDRTDEYVNWLRSIHVNFQILNGDIIVFGYKRTAQQGDAPDALSGVR